MRTTTSLYHRLLSSSPPLLLSSSQASGGVVSRRNTVYESWLPAPSGQFSRCRRREARGRPTEQYLHIYDSDTDASVLECSLEWREEE